jgi:Flp pilus assembly protein TadG
MRLQTTNKPAIPRRRNRRSGVTMMEFAVVAPILLMFVFGCFEICRMSLIRNMAIDAAYDACRHSMVEGATAAEATQKAIQVLNQVGTRDAVIVINDGVAFDTKTKVIKVDITIPMDKNAYLLKYFFTNRQIKATISMNMERYSGFYDASK